VLGGLGADHFGEGPVFVVLAIWFAAAACSCGGPRRRREALRSHRPATPAAIRRGLAVPGRASVLLTVFVEGILSVRRARFVPTHLHRVTASR
jgi:hypothetical protein